MHCNAAQISKLCTDLRTTGGCGGAQSPTSECATGGALQPPVLPLDGRGHWGHKVIDDWKTVGGNTTGKFCHSQMLLGIFIHLRTKINNTVPIQY